MAAQAVGWGDGKTEVLGATVGAAGPIMSNDLDHSPLFAWARETFPGALWHIALQ